MFIMCFGWFVAYIYKVLKDTTILYEDLSLGVIFIAIKMNLFGYSS